MSYNVIWYESIPGKIMNKIEEYTRKGDCDG